MSSTIKPTTAEQFDLEYVSKRALQPELIELKSKPWTDWIFPIGNVVLCVIVGIFTVVEFNWRLRRKRQAAAKEVKECRYLDPMPSQAASKEE
ncbi:hypothetical protein BOX15_Mlig017988g1 [Macrostomum lignano]|uniref:Uncharacterized protein n=1 Tax=Macrostomum lignano TaxID=282301 RepID=A0A267FAY5_9PLAT|nr:hypothetical protein BOX15_Mlig017988g3 [Macrostomum lignano]PAA61772.1 hypothetical protein BOX15_Mlig017988g2 [Macrostomum lignano]PAA70172.1 hypothetical protein BOX15_Mlig017988g1 [Macrostomum lignano]